MDKEFIAKIEGHGRLHINWKRNKVNLELFEGERLFEGLMVNRSITEAPWITSRICGVCPIAHNLASLKAAEAALKIKVSDSVKELRKLMVIAQMIQSHALHLYFLALPDYLDLDSGLEISKKYPKNFKDALILKEFSDDLAEVVAGRRVHPTTTALGGFHRQPKKTELAQLIKKAENALQSGENTVKLFLNLKYPQIETPLVFLSLFNGKEYATYEGEAVVSSQGKKLKVKDYKKFIQEKIKNNSTAKFGYHQGRGFMVGAMARLNLQNKFLNPLAKKYFAMSHFDFENPYYNNLAQAIEILHFSEEAMKVLEKLSKKAISGVQPANLMFGSVQTGIGAIEAPRGTLYHELKADKNGFITYANIITPTVQNLTSIEEVAQKVLESTKKLPQKKRERLIEMLLRAYDPCITCSVH